MKKSLLAAIAFSLNVLAFAQNPTAIISTNPEAEKVMLGLYNPADYGSVTPVMHNVAAQGMQNNISPERLKESIIKLASFKNRNSGSDTVSPTTGIGAARRWIYSKFEEYSAENGNRLIPSYIQFNENICSVTQHRNIIAVLPGTDTTDKSIILVEGHMDSRCKGLCDIACVAEGVEDNASGTALVLELARVMSKYRYKNTIVFMATVAEEQSLNGATAFAVYALQKKIAIKAVQNNDVIGGIACGKTSSPPSCPGLDDIDSTQVRIFSAGLSDSPHKNLARFAKLQYKEELLPYVTVPMMITVMSAEDRTGRGGDHQPFRQRGFTAIRFTSANEHGNANSTSPDYTDRQHDSRDVLGVDTDGDTEIDSFFVDFNYLARNAAINGVSMAMAAIGPKTPTFKLSKSSNGGLKVEVLTQTQYPAYRIGLRTTGNDWDTLLTITSLADSFPVQAGKNYFVTLASVDENGVESLFGREYSMQVTGINSPDAPAKGIELLQNKPNPFDEATMISFIVNGVSDYKSAHVTITDITGKEIKRLPVELKEGINEVLYEHGYGVSGIYLYNLFIDNKNIASRRMVFTAN
jgi:hypothetical protein